MIGVFGHTLLESVLDARLTPGRWKRAELRFLTPRD
jgi:hypothetical protein